MFELRACHAVPGKVSDSVKAGRRWAFLGRRFEERTLFEHEKRAGTG
jgi:hypothetical protein